MAYSPEKNLVVWVPNGSYGAAKIEVGSVPANTSPSLPNITSLVVPNAPSFTNSGKVIWNPFLSSFLVAGYSSEADAYRLPVLDSVGSWTQVLSGNEPLKNKLENMNITALGACPVSEVLAGDIKGTTSIWYRNYTDLFWQKAAFEQPGVITAMSYVGFGWYIATWDATIQTATGYGLSSLWFAPPNFTVVVYLDEWNAANRNVKIETISFYATQEAGVCPSGFEPSNEDPSICYKTCPAGFQGIGSLCAGICPPGFGTSQSPYVCLPNRYTPSRMHPLQRTVRNAITPSPISSFDPTQGIAQNNGNAAKMGVGVGLGVAVLGALLFSIPKV
jgi:hypothetical protein